MNEQGLVIGDRPGYTPGVARLVAMMEYVRQSTLREVEGLSVAQLDHLHDAESNSIGALLHHIAAIERSYQSTLGVAQRAFGCADADWRAAEELGARGRQRLRGKPLEFYAGLLAAVRETTLAGLRAKDDAWLDAEERWGNRRVNYHWIWFHVFEDELNHRGQIRWLKRRLPR